jgi:hypothetical protein
MRISDHVNAGLRGRFVDCVRCATGGVGLDTIVQNKNTDGPHVGLRSVGADSSEDVSIQVLPSGYLTMKNGFSINGLLVVNTFGK